ncbi:putative glycerol-3-phosphate dehydrogenase [Streptomyces venezuelae]|uniref:FAD-dependent oxidoreductase n=1 Tax=Streptomyces gardneri TaxID=66892 RepID=UPI0006BC9DFD|nr:FAD-dependent oxidoreductase [Streptomyces gardneri]ALO06522.1 putative glycerol-3-phosphate dehydrogenase [Streptomyces venezuelae]QPK43951.1 FAD-dependent oxidoreductase [Streptomyces gardneri]WRK35217.1 FAD-dependent oxidoreductase [Streptomyces venezuelae]CUM43205.1 Glycerol-3-phosphate dehydrogenase [Streptomyces venezuelae]
MSVTRTGPLPSGSEAEYDVVVVGAGVVGCAIARALARHPLRVALVEAAGDVGDGTSKANTAILHTGFDAAPGTLEARLVREGHRLLGAFAGEAGIPVEPLGALLVAWDEQQRAALPRLAEKAERNGHRTTRLLSADELRLREPHLGPGALAALAVPGESVICPWTTTLAYATQAVRSGVDLHLDCRVEKVRTGDPWHRLVTRRGELRTRHLVNACGLHADAFDALLDRRDFTVTPRRGQLLVFDKFARDLVRHILLPVPGPLGKGVLVSPTVYGNVMLGPTAEDLDDKTATGTTTEGLAGLREQGGRIVPALLDEEVTAVYAGLRAATEQEDYRCAAHPALRYVTVGGIRSTGLSASLALAEHVLGLLADCGLEPGPERPLAPVRMPNLGEAFPRPYRDAELIAREPEFGMIVCHCERVTRGEIRAAFASDIPPAGPDGLRRRTRARGGRCQGHFCGAEVRALSEEYGKGAR